MAKSLEEKRLYNRQWYQNNVESVSKRKSIYGKENRSKLSEKRRKEHQANRLFITQQKIGKVCTSCGVDDYRVLDFHHLNSDEKEIHLGSSTAAYWSKEHILREIAKCIILCANCHRILHWEEEKGT